VATDELRGARDGGTVVAEPAQGAARDLGARVGVPVEAQPTELVALTAGRLADVVEQRREAQRHVGVRKPGREALQRLELVTQDVQMMEPAVLEAFAGDQLRQQQA